MLRIQKVRIILSVILLLFISGCGQKHETRDDRVLAKINDYELKVSDLKEAADPALLKQYASYSPIKDKEQLLEALISKEVLLQEAQKLDLDKEKSFMKEIEGYWEQALLKSLISKRIKELAVNITVTDREIANEYDRLKRKVLVELVIFSDRASAEKLAKSSADFDAVKQALKSHIISEVPADWYASRDLPPAIENVLFSTRPGTLSGPIEYNNSWIILRVLNEEERVIKPLEELKAQIANNIMRVKKQEVLEKWSAELRRKASVKINRDVLKGIDLR